jgi:cell wall-associated NlpC family hydrolase
MNRKIILILLLPLLLFSCHINKRKKVSELIRKFEQEKTIDKSETVFNIESSFNHGDLILTGETDNRQLKNDLLTSLKKLKPTDKITLLPDSTVGDKFFGLINLSVANLRSKPRHSAELITQALLGTPVKILKAEGGWYKIQTPDKYISWVYSAGIQPITQKQLTNWKLSKRIIYTADNGLIYKTEKFKSPISDITMGNILEETNRNYKAIKAQLPDGRTGFTKLRNWTDFKTFKNNTTPDSTTIKQMAEQWNGRPYLWGGTSVRAMDCSGFVKTLYFMNGIILPRDALQQAHCGNLVDTETDFDDVVTGDLLFFGKKATAESAEKITHVALSFGGTEYMNEAGRMKMNSFNPKSDIFSKYRKNSFIRAKRIIGSADASGVLQLKNHPWY